jgi:23S rRNA (uracil1939-C5)-methyltransferase
MRRGERLSLLCEGLDDDGYGVGTSAGCAVHVAGGVPGDTLEVTVEHLSPHAARVWARLECVISASPGRVTAACPNVPHCGGCVMQCVAYPGQLASKQQRIARALAGLVDDIRPIRASPRVLGYRNKAKLVVARSQDGHTVLGSYAPRSHRVIDMAGCQVTEPVLGPVVGTLRQLLDAHAVPPYDETARTGELRYAILRANAAGRVLCVLVATDPQPAWAGPLAQALVTACPEIAGVVLNVNTTRGGALLGPLDRRLEGAAELADRVGEVELALSARAFFQVNREQAGALYAAAAAAAREASGGVAVDAYAGVGGIALSLAADAARVVAIEDNAAATADAARSAERLGRANVEVVTADALAGLARLTEARVVVLNPPRKGCSPDVLRAAARLHPERLIYVSCGPDSLARDLALLGKSGYRADFAQPFDLFPHTPHIETLTVCRPIRHASGA